MKWFKKLFNFSKSIEENLDNMTVCERLKNDYGDPDVYGPWTKSEECVDKNGKIKFFKSYWLITTNDKSPEIDILENEREKLLKIRKDKLDKLKFL
jgi:hypothetical protein